MKSEFKLIAYTLPGECEYESEKICRILNAGIDKVHIRKPDADRESLARILKSIPQEWHSRLKIHNHFDLADDFPEIGLHLNSKSCELPANFQDKPEIVQSLVSKTYHLQDDIAGAGIYEYATLSPIYASISKLGYGSDSNLDRLKGLLSSGRFVALGGIVPERFRELREAGFYGAAMLGYIWNGDFDVAIQNILHAKSLL